MQVQESHRVRQGLGTHRSNDPPFPISTGISADLKRAIEQYAFDHDEISLREAQRRLLVAGLRAEMATEEIFTVEIDNVSITQAMDAIDGAIRMKHGDAAVERVYQSGSSIVEKVTIVVKVVIPDAPAKPEPDEQ